MKKITFILTALIAITIKTNAQWTQQTSGTTKNLWGVSFVNENIGFVCGDAGTILKTINGGANWIPQNSGTTYQLGGLQFVNANVGYCMSFSDAGGKIIKTINGGTTWNDISLNISGAHSGGVYFFNANTGLLALGNSSYTNSKILKTVNGGISWDTVYSGAGWISFFHFPDSNNGYATVSGSKVLKTTDGGNNWSLLNNIGGNLWMSGVYFFNKDTGFVSGGDFSLGGGSIFKTTNGGSTWQTLSTVYGTSVMLFNKPNIGYSIGFDNTNAKKILKTIDGGISWVFDTTPTDSILNGISFPTANIGYVTGNGGTILKTTIGTSIAENIIKERINIYPNPASEFITLSNDLNNKSDLTLNIYNLVGELVKSEMLKQNQQQINIGDLSDGIYVITIKSKDLKENQRLIIQR